MILSGSKFLSNPRGLSSASLRFFASPPTAIFRFSPIFLLLFSFLFFSNSRGLSSVSLRRLQQQFFVSPQSFCCFFPFCSSQTPLSALCSQDFLWVPTYCPHLQNLSTSKDTLLFHFFQLVCQRPFQLRILPPRVVLLLARVQERF